MTKTLPNFKDANGRILVPISEASKILKVSYDTLRRWDQKGKLTAKRPDGKNRYFLLEELENLKSQKSLSISQASELLGISQTTLRRLDEKGVVVPRREGKNRVYELAELENFLSSQYFQTKRHLSKLEKLPKSPGKPSAQNSDNKIQEIETELQDEEEEIHQLFSFKQKVLAVSLITLLISLLLVTGLTLAFLRYPIPSSKFMGFRDQAGNKLFASPNISSSNLYPSANSNILGASTVSSSGSENLVRSILVPFSRVSLAIVEKVNPQVYEEVIPKNINEAFKINANQIIPQISINFPKSSYLKVGDKGLIKNLNADYLRGRVPGSGIGDIAYFSQTGVIDGLNLDSSNFSSGSVDLASAAITGILGLANGGTGEDLSNATKGGLIFVANGKLGATDELHGMIKGNGTSAPSAVTGTSGLLVRWADDYTIGNSAIYDNGNIGIGNIDPGEKLDVSGNIYARSGQIRIGNFDAAPTAIGAGSLYYDTVSTQVYYYNGSSWQVVGSGSGGSGGGFWNQASGALFPFNSTVDALIGGQSTASAKFAFINVNSGTPAIQINGTTVLDPTTLGSGVVNSSLTSVGILNGGSITSGFGSIDTGADNIVTTGTIGSAGNTAFTGASLTLTTFLSANGSQGSATQCLLGGSAATWGSCGTGTTNSPFEELSGAIVPLNSTEDLLIGGQSTTSAKFALTGINSARGSQVATLSGSLVLDSSSAGIQTTNGQSLSLGGTTTGFVKINNKSGSPFAVFDTINGRLGIGATSPGGPLHVFSNQNADQAYNINSDVNHNTAVAGTVYGISNTATAGNSSGTTSTLIGISSQAAFNAVQSAQSNVAVNSLIGTFTRTKINGANTTGTISNGYGLYVDQISNQGTGSPAVTYTNQYGIRVINQGTASGAGTGLTIGTSYGLYIDSQSGAGTSYAAIFAGGSVGIGTTTPASELQVTRALSVGATGKALATFDQIENQDILTASKSGTSVFKIDSSGNIRVAGGTTLDTGSGVGMTSGSIGLGTSNATSVLIGKSGVTTTVSGPLTINNTSTLTIGGALSANASNGTSIQCLLGGSTAAWGSCSTGTINSPFTELSGAIVPLNSTEDFILGAQSTSSAKFSVTGVNNGTPTLTLAGGTRTTGPVATIAAAFNPTAGGTQAGLSLAFQNNPNTAANTLKGLDIRVTDDTQLLANTIYGINVNVDVASTTSARIAGLFNGGSVIQTPTTPTFVGGADSADDNTGADNMQTIFVSGRYAYVGKSSNAGTCNSTNRVGCEVMIFDVTNPSSPSYVGGVDTGSQVVHSIYVVGKYLYIARTGSSGTCSIAIMLGCELQIWDISNVNAPFYIGGVDSVTAGNGTDQFNSVFVSGRYAYIGKAGNSGTCSSSDRTGCEFQVYDVSNPTAPVFVGGSDTISANNGTDDILSVYVSGHFAYVGKKTNAGTCSTSDRTGCEFQVYDVLNPNNPVYTSGGNAADAIGINNVYVSGRYAYFVNSSISGACNSGSSTGCEFAIYDIANPYAATFVGGVPLSGNAKGVSVSGRYAYITKSQDTSGCNSSTSTGCELTVYDVSTVSSPTFMGGVDTFQTLGPLYVSGRYAYVGQLFGTNGPCSSTNNKGCEFGVYDLSGVEATSVVAGSLESGVLQVRTDAVIGNQLSVAGGLNVGAGGIYSQGPLSIYSTQSAQLNLTGRTVGQALAIFNEIGNQDIFTASASGVTKFTITGAGGISLGANDLQVGTATQCLLGGATASWGSCAAGTITSPFKELSGAIVPLNSTEDFLLGSQATSSALFSFTGVSNLSHQTIASVSGQLIVMPNNGFGNVGIGTANPLFRLDITQPTNSYGVRTGDGTVQVGMGIDGSTNGFIGTRSNHNLLFNTNNVEGARLGSNGTFGLGTTAAISQLHVTRALTRAVTGKALVVFDQIENQDIFTASASGVTKFTVTNTGAVLIPNNVAYSSYGTGGAVASLAKVSAANHGIYGLNGEIDTGGASLTLGYSGSTTINLGTTNSAPVTVNIGTGGQADTINLGGTGDTINIGGNVGIGTALPGFALDLQTSQSATAAAQIYNTNTGSDADGLILKLGNTSTSVVSTTNHFISFETAGIGIVGSIQGNGGKNVAYATNGVADFAEYMKKDPSQAIEWGSVLCQNTAGNVVPCDQDSSSIVGVASQFPTFIGGENKGNASITVGLTGIVPAKVSSANGAIKSGDYISSSDVPGVGVKATKAGQIVGVALEDYTSAGVGKIQVRVGPSWYDPNVYVQDGGYLSIAPAVDNNFEVKRNSGEKVSRVGAFSESVVGKLRAGIIEATTITATSLNIKTEDVRIGDKTLAEYIDSRVGGAPNQETQNKITDLQSQIDSLNQVLGSSTQSAQLTSLQADILQKQQELALLQTSNATPSAQSDGKFEKIRVTGNGIIEGVLTVLDTLNVNDFIVNGASTFFGQVIFKDKVSFQKGVVLSKDNAGTINLSSGAKSVKVVFSKPYDTVPIVNATMQVGSGAVPNVTYGVQDISEKGFTIVLNQKSTDDIKFSWIAVEAGE